MAVFAQSRALYERLYKPYFGKGEMSNWARGCSSSYPGWYDYAASITEVSIGSKVTTIGNYAFEGLVNLR